MVAPVSHTRTVSVIHLIWLPYGINLFKQFIQSYKQFAAGAEHELLLVFNGVQQEADTTAYHDYIKSHQLVYRSINIKEGQDLACYFEAAAQSTAEYIMVLNSFSIILSDQWLKKYLDNFAEPATGLVGASASCQSYYSSVFQKNSYGWETDKSFLHNFRKYKLFIKAFLYWRFLFEPFPAAHIRTNAFMIRRNIFVQLQHQPFVSKFAAYQFESGRNSLSRQVERQGLQVLVTDRNGKTYTAPEWASSRTFWIAGQENLLVSDNQTRIYDNSTETEKKKMTWLAWGKHA